MHDDTFILDRNFRAKILATFRANPGLGLLGVVGASEITSLAWWESRSRVGEVCESRGFIDLGSPRGFVDVVDGLFIAVSRNAFMQLHFDEQAFPGFHGYDADYCLQTRAAGLACMVIPLEILHKTKGVVGNKDDFISANNALIAKCNLR